ncbi:hypothetical protein BHE74_00057914, partial [Ensete ventricosum]
ATGEEEEHRKNGIKGAPRAAILATWLAMLTVVAAKGITMAMAGASAGDRMAGEGVTYKGG